MNGLWRRGPLIRLLSYSIYAKSQLLSIPLIATSKSSLLHVFYFLSLIYLIGTFMGSLSNYIENVRYVFIYKYFVCVELILALCDVQQGGGFPSWVESKE